MASNTEACFFVSSVVADVCLFPDRLARKVSRVPTGERIERRQRRAADKLRRFLFRLPEQRVSMPGRFGGIP